MAQSQSQAIRTFVLGNKEIEGKTVEFQYDHGWYSICDISGEERSVVYKSRNAQEAYMKWNVYIGRKKERPQRNAGGDEQRGENSSRQRQNQNRSDRGNREERKDRTDRSNREERKDRTNREEREDRIGRDERSSREERSGREEQSRSRSRNRSENRGARQERSRQNQRRKNKNKQES
jgi:hypothetical protein